MLASWRIEAAVVRRVNAELLLLGRQVKAVYDRVEGLVLTDDQSQVFQLPKPECVPHVVANILCLADFGDYDKLLHLIECSTTVTLTRNDDEVSFVATGHTL